MGRWWPLLLLAVLLLAASARADPAISSTGPNAGLATWTFSNPANYTSANVTLGASGGSLAWHDLSFRDTTQKDFSTASSLDNIDLLTSPGKVILADRSQQGPVQNLTIQADATSVADTFINRATPTWNFGTLTQLWAGNSTFWGLSRTLLEFPFPSAQLPANATIVGAQLELYYYGSPGAGVMNLSVHRMTSNWTDANATWNTRDGTTPWAALGGDFNPAALDTVVGFTNATAWVGWNVTSAVEGWWAGTYPNDGLLLRQEGDTSLSQGTKSFYSSDSANLSVHPRLRIAYTTPSSRGSLVSAPFDTSGAAVWGQVWWNATVPPGTTVNVRVRTGNAIPVDASWSPWSPPLPAVGTPVPGGPMRYLEYELDLFTSSSTTPSVQDITVTAGLYAASGTAESFAFAPEALQGWGILTINASAPAGTSVTVTYSQDGGASWLPAADGVNLSAALPRGIILQVTLGTSNTTVTPTIESITLGYRTGAGSNLLGIALPWGIAFAAIVALAAFLVLTRLRRSFTASELLVIHTDGRLVAHVGSEGPLDELATSAMLTLVLQFVRDSFQGPQGQGGDLKSFAVDDKEVAITKGGFLYLALVGKGRPSPQLATRMVAYLAGLEATYRTRLEHWDGLRASTGRLDEDLIAFLRKGSRTGLGGRAARYHA